MYLIFCTERLAWDEPLNNLVGMTDAVATNLPKKKVLIAFAVDTDIDINILWALFWEKVWKVERFVDE